MDPALCFVSPWGTFTDNSPRTWHLYRMSFFEYIYEILLKGGSTLGSKGDKYWVRQCGANLVPSLFFPAWHGVLESVRVPLGTPTPLTLATCFKIFQAPAGSPFTCHVKSILSFVGFFLQQQVSPKYSGVMRDSKYSRGLSVPMQNKCFPLPLPLPPAIG